LARRKVEQVVYEIIEPLVTKTELELVDVEYKKEGQNWFLRIFIDRPGGVRIEDCQFISEKISDLLDQADPIRQSYYLEVSSPGIERPLNKLEHFVRFQGEKVKINTYSPIGNRKSFIGIIVGINNENILLNLDSNQEVSIPFEQITKANLVGDF
jgi:ribosome maturation factor RimP